MKDFEIHYYYKKTKHGDFIIRVRAVDEKDARRIAYNKIDNRVFELI